MEHNWPTMNLMKQLYAEGKLTPAQATLVAPTRPSEELYDLRTDPHELRNLADSLDHQDILARLRTKLDTWIHETNDHGAIAEDPNVIKRVEDFFIKRFGP